MDLSQPSLPPQADERDPADCAFARRLGAYHDGELDAASAALVADHLPTCPACQAELMEIAELSSLAGEIGAGGISRQALVAVHRAIDAEDRFSLLRISGALTAIAASALVVGSAWLIEAPVKRPAPRAPIVLRPADQKSWEGVAMGALQRNPLPRSDWDEREGPMFNDTRLADAIVRGLGGDVRGGTP